MRSNSHGFSITELSVVMLIGLVLSGLSLMGFQQVNAVYSSTSAEEIIAGKLRQARSMALSQRKNIVVTFEDPDQIKLSVQTSQTSTTLLESMSLPVGSVYTNGPGGSEPEPIQGIVRWRNGSVVFLGDSTARDFVTGALVNGVVYIGRAGASDNSAAGAVTVLGSTGRVRSYRYDMRTGGWF
ncbi:MAG: prepilin-type N-terminal cleavage/methylation domain-containing protein [Acidobacteria bacterium]|nr:prepilin-type N-terminal cleavage/methylation domain-containing protein [Acidobacteriota bacterium]MBI3655959.1 prepilin-type N-terminal cleavage/methylation domain-containing protein [Acidobacteriota bacterium]